MLAQLGQLSLLAAFVFAILSGLSSLLATVRHDERLAITGQRAMGVVTVLVTLAMVCLWRLIFLDDFTVEYVAGHSNRELPWAYKMGSLWSGQQGSLLLWTWILVLYCAAAIYTQRRRHNRLLPHAIVVMSGVAVFFLWLNNFESNPFARLVQVSGGEVVRAFSPQDGRGLNPLLQHPAMVIHPPILYMGYIGFVIPFAFAIAALWTRQLGSAWIITIRRWTLFTWAFLGVGILLGARWAYEELGWGGYWAWDPVENASLMPWLAGTAFLHSVVIQEKRGMLKVWNVSLICAAFLLCIVGTFLTRSGVVSSVHSFARSDIGVPFAIFIVALLVLSVGLIVARLPYLRSENRLDSLMSRESGFLFNNLLFLAMAVSVLVGTVFPIFSEMLTGRNVSVGQPFFNRVEIPLGLMVLFLTGAGPLLAWRKTSSRSLRRNFVVPVAAGLASLPLLLLAGVHGVWPLASLVLCTFTTACILQEFHKGARARVRQLGENYALATANLVRRNSRRYGGYVVHLGIVLLFVGLTGAAFVQEGRFVLSVGEQATLGRFTVQLESLAEDENDNYWAGRAQVALYEDGVRQGTMHPEKRYYFASEQPSTEVAIASTAGTDLYLVYAGLDENGQRAVLQGYLNPLVAWIWVGGVVMLLGTGLCMLPPPRKGAEA